MDSSIDTSDRSEPNVGILNSLWLFRGKHFHLRTKLRQCPLWSRSMGLKKKIEASMSRALSGSLILCWSWHLFNAGVVLDSWTTVTSRLSLGNLLVFFILFESRHIPVTQHRSATPATILLPGVGRNSTFTHKMYGDDSDELER